MSAPALPLGPNVRIASWHPCGLLALDKPEGLLSHPNTPQEQGQSVLNAPYDPQRQAYHWNDGQLFLLNRLDSPTSGLLLAATDPAIATLALEAFRTQKVEKTYLAIVRGRPPATPSIWQDYLSKHAAPGKGVRTTRGQQYAARTRIRVERSDAHRLGLTLLRLYPLTGRTHQLRVQCALRHHPILGDRTYGDFALNQRFVRQGGSKRLFLHATHLTLTLRHAGQTLHFEATSPPPPPFTELIPVAPG